MFETIKECICDSALFEIFMLSYEWRALSATFEFIALSNVLKSYQSAHQHQINIRAVFFGQHFCSHAMSESEDLLLQAQASNDETIVDKPIYLRSLSSKAPIDRKTVRILWKVGPCSVIIPVIIQTSLISNLEPSK